MTLMILHLGVLLSEHAEDESVEWRLTNNISRTPPDLQSAGSHFS